MDNYNIVLCGKCGRRVGSAHPKVKTIQVYDCRKCHIRNKYDPVTGKVTVKEIPQRATSSGMFFI